MRSGLIPLLVSAYCSSVLAVGCSGSPTVHPRTAASAGREIDSTILACRSLMASGPGSARLHARLGEALLGKTLLRAGRYRTLFLAEYGGDDVILRDLGEPIGQLPAFHSSDTLREAESQILQALAGGDGDAATIRSLARVYLTLDQVSARDSLKEKAAALFRESIAIDSTSAEAHAGLASILLRQSRAPEAIAALYKSLRYDSSNGSTYLTLGEAFMDTGNVTVAFACFENAARLGLRTAGEYLRLADHYTDTQAETRLIGRLASLRKQAPALLQPTVHAVMKAANMYHPAIAIDLAGAALEADDSCAEAHILRAELLLAEHDSDSAEGELSGAIESGTAPFWRFAWFPPRVLEHACTRTPEQEALLLLLGSAYRHAGQDTVARRIFRDAVEKRPSCATAAFFLGYDLERSRDTAGAISWYERALALPTEIHPYMYSFMAYTLLRRGETGRGVAAFQKQLAQPGSDWLSREYAAGKNRLQNVTGRMQLGAAYCMAGQFYSWQGGVRSEVTHWRGISVGLFNKARRLVPEAPGPYICLAELSIDNGEEQEAYRYFRKAAALGSAEAVQTMKRMEKGKL